MTNIKLYIPILLVILTWSDLGYAQNNQNNTVGEIWMTEAELESFLTSIASRKKQQIEKEKHELRLRQYRLDTLHLSKVSVHGNRELLHELKQINDRIDFLYKNTPIIGYGESIYTPTAKDRSTTDFIPNDQVALERNDLLTTATGPRSQNFTEGSTYALTESPRDPTSWQQVTPTEELALQAQVDALNRQISMLSAQLQTGIATSENNDDSQIATVQKSIDELNNVLQRKGYQPTVERPIAVRGRESFNNHSAFPIQPVIVYQPQSSKKDDNTEKDIAQPRNDTPIVVADTALSQQLYASTLLNFHLQEQIDSLYHMLGNNDSTGHPDINTEIQSVIEALTAEVNQLKANTATTPEVKALEKEINPHEAAIKSYQHSIYFANNSSTISDTDLAALNGLRHKLEDMNMRVTVILRGFSSSIGNAEYNDRLSRRRAEVVKQVLLQLGMMPQDIVTLYHGADASKSEELARRVEVSLSTY